MVQSSPTQRERAEFHSTTHHPYVHERLPSSPPPPFYAQSPQLNASSHSLRIPSSRHPHLPHNVPYHIHPSPHDPSAQSSPLTSPSSAHGGSSHFADSQSSFTSESASPDPSASRSPYDLPNRISPPTFFGTPPSPAPNARSRSITESDLRLPTHDVTRTSVSRYPPSSARPRTAPSPTPINLDNPDSLGIKFLLSKPAQPSPSRVSLQSDPEATWRTTPRKSRPHPPELDVSASPSPAHSHPDLSTRASSTVVSSLNSPSVSSMPPQKKQRNVLRRKPSAKVKEKLQREFEKRQDPSPASPSSPTRASLSNSRDWPLTPARTVVHVYKHQEQPMEGAGNDTVPPSPTPYYTVYGTQSERKITAGGPDDSDWSLHAHVLAEQRAQAEPSRSLSRKGSLSRKVSSRWKKATGGGVESPSNSRPSLQDVYSSSHLRQSLDPGVFGRHTRSVTDPQNKTKEKESAQGSSSKIWKLMKRISTGGLRERFQVDTAAPPVPAIPKELLNSPPPIRKDPQATSPNPYSASKPKSIAGSGSGPRPSMATSSSSPNSSDVASGSFFHASHSRGSSVSSYGEETASALFPSMGDRRTHIVSGDGTKDQGLLSSSSSRSYSGHTTPIANDQRQETKSPRCTPIPISQITHPIHSSTSLRRHKHEKPPTPAHTHSRSLFNGDGSTPVSAPSRPSLSMMPSRSSQSEKSPARSAFVINDEASFRASLRAPSEASTARMRPWSNSTTSTAKIRPWSNSTNCTRKDKDPSTSTSNLTLTSQSRSPINYRALNAPRKPPLTEREKAEIWDNLLERSDLAGGTLHIGGGSGELESDHLRFSGYSEVEVEVEEGCSEAVEVEEGV
ncbi:uncharacterized protein EDB91DRAFT_1101563 [Suillus paluster]|uniref:uncharacterized protein n=1 Tax=Suillus paluster TaxID=48578 RepID=UPI001B86BD1D|nr:uncharacterized protein EDB91DRAFT_1101563 [Suillus paluster]KAG1752285.1 hypothetical protein EDB91DRAFT_1101563 [Suillus paluster]